MILDLRLVATSVILVTAGGQDSSRVPPKTLLKLGSKDPVRVAQGCYESAEQGLVKAVPAIRRRLIDFPEGNWAEREGAMLSILDALIRLDAEVTDEELRVAFSQEPVQAAILLLRRPQQHREVALDYLESSAYGRAWFAVANLLFDAREPRLVTRLLETLTLELDVTARAGEYFDPRDGGGYGGRYGDRSVRGLPPLFDYVINTEKLPDHELLSAGPTSFYYHRHPHRKSWPTSPFDDDEYRLALLARLAETPREMLALAAEREVEVEWTDDSSFCAEVRALAGDIEDSYERLCEKLVDQGLLLAPVPLNLELRLSDRRSQDRRAAPLPDPLADAG